MRLGSRFKRNAVPKNDLPRTLRVCRGEGIKHTDDNWQQGPMTLGELAKKMVVENTAFT